MDVTSPDQARIAQAAGAVAVMALERTPSDIRRDGGVARMSHPKLIRSIQEAVNIPVMAKCRVGHFVEAQLLQELKIDVIDESEVLTLADDIHHINKHPFDTAFVCGARNIGEALRRYQEGASMLRTKGEAGTGNIIEAVRHARQIDIDLRRILAARDRPEDLRFLAKEFNVNYETLQLVLEKGRLPVVTFAAGGVATPADAVLLMQLGVDGIFVGSGIFHSADPKAMAKGIVDAVKNWNNPKKVLEASMDIPSAMKGLEIDDNIVRMATREQP